jgi:protein-disulfide isomerase
MFWSSRFRGFACVVVVATAGLVLSAGTASSQSTPDDLRREIEALKKGQETILKELQDLKRLLQPRPTEAAPNPKGIVLNIGSRPVVGSSNAPLTLVEISDYQCPFCGQYRQQTQPLIETEFVRRGVLRRVFFDLPLENMHALAFKAALATRCAGEQDQYLAMQERLFLRQQALEPWTDHAAALGLDTKRFSECMDSARYAGDVRRDMTEVQAAGIRSTPSFLLARSDPSNPAKVVGVSLITGAQPYDVFRKEIEQALAGAPAPH